MITNIYPKTKNEVVGLQKVYLKITEILQKLNLIAPVSYKKYVALLNQSSTDAPVASVLENTLVSVPIWSRSSDGDYLLTLSDAFIGSVVLFIGAVDDPTSVFTFAKTSNNTISLKTKIAGTGTDDLLSNTSIEIRVYQ